MDIKRYQALIQYLSHSFNKTVHLCISTEFNKVLFLKSNIICDNVFCHTKKEEKKSVYTSHVEKSFSPI